MLRLKKSIYGLVQAARQWFLKFEEALKTIGFRNNQIDPCLFIKKDDGKFCAICVYVDDCILTGDQTMMKEVIEGLKKVFAIKIQKNIDDFLGCNIIMGKNDINIFQKRIHDNLKDLIEPNVSTDKFKTPSSPGFAVVRQEKKEGLLNGKDQKWFRSSVGSLLYMVKFSRPDIANSVRELSKVMDLANYGQKKELNRLLNFVYHGGVKGLKMKPTEETIWEIEAFSDSDFAGDKNGRRSVTGFIILVCNTPISWKSKSQGNVTLSSTEAKYVALSETVREVKFITKILDSLCIAYKTPIKVNVDNTGALFLSNNKTSGERTKHIDIKYHYVRELVEKKFVEIKFVKSEDNLADLFTKNLGGEAYSKHSNKLLIEKDDF